MVPIIIDTDIGDDIDDLYFLTTFFRVNALYDLKGITTVFKNSALRAELAKKVVRTFSSSEVKTYPGINGTVSVPLFLNNHSSTQLIEFSAYEFNSNTEYASDFIIQTVLGSKEKVKVIAIGPLTNIAMAILKEPTIIKNMELIMMGGSLKSSHPEWNLRCDPEAAKIVLESNLQITMYGLEATEPLKVSLDWLEEVFNLNTKTANFLTTYTKKWQPGSTDGELGQEACPILFDCAVLCELFWNDLNREVKYLSLDVNEDGSIRTSNARKKTIKYIMSVDSDGLLKKLLHIYRN